MQHGLLLFAVHCERFAVDGVAGFEQGGWHPTGGIRPRHFALDGSRLYVAHERAHTIDTHLIDPETGALTATGESMATASPVCVVLAAFE
ncbi:MAG TPA: beta-propeller fold lactonase family protein [Aldersonia sp.]